jgi:hypothetical protein
MNLKPTGWILLLGALLTVIGTRSPIWKAFAQSTQGGESSDGAQKKQREVELRFWQDVDKTSVEELKLYLQKYPNGEFADLARAKLAKLQRHQEQAEESSRQQNTAKESAPTKLSSEPQIVEEHLGGKTATSDFSVSLEGTVWEGAGWREGDVSRSQVHVEFLTGGILRLSGIDQSKGDTSYTWEQEGNSFKVRWPHCGFSLEGSVKENHIEGHGRCTKHWVFGEGFSDMRTLRWEFTRVPRWDAEEQRKAREKAVK